jgi:hypothetical protein
MSKTVHYRQCLLVRPYDKGEMRLMSWIPEKFAVAGKRVRLRDGGAWQDGWVVRDVGPYRVADKDLPDVHDDVKGHRRRTGDALPRLTPPPSETSA